LYVVVASTNPVKLESARQGFAQVFSERTVNVTGVEVDSGVSDQPMNDMETLAGARNRAANACIAQPQAHFWVGIEGGVEEVAGTLQAFAWVVVESRDRRGRGRTGTFVLPDEVSILVHQGMELGHADDVVFKRDNSKQQNGSVGILTGDLIDRVTFYVPAVVLALIPFMNPDLTFSA
jgi:inosine/xanthosine triphosphatase